MSATILIPQFRVTIVEMLRGSFRTIKELALAADESERTVERWWRGETCPNAAQFLLLTLNSDPFSSRVQLLHDELKQQRTVINARLERLRATRPSSIADLDRKRVERSRQLGSEAGGSGAEALRHTSLRRA